MTMNILQERYQFHHRQQKYHESVEEFVVEIRRLASTCQFESQEECLIRDHILFGLKNQRISMQIIQKGGNPSVTDIIEVCIESGGGRCRKPKGIGKQLAAIKPEEPEFHGVIVKEEDILFQDAYFGEESELDHQDIGRKVAYTDDSQDVSPCLEAACTRFSESSAEEEMFGYLETSNSPDETSERPNKSRKLASERTCHICGKLSKSAYSLKLHMYTHSSVKTVPCPLCPRYFKNNRHLRSHTFNKHTIRPQAECSICRKVFKTEATLQLHNANTHPPTSDDPAGKREYECYFCHKTCISELQLRRHMYIHVRGRKMLCPQCGKCFSDVHKLNRHLKRTDHLSGQDVVKPFKCSKCDKAFMDRHGLQTHAFIHSDVAEFGCEECGKHFKTKGNLRQHQRTHFPAKYFCQYCDHKCRSSGNLQKHMKVHTGR